jgi:putative ABC transport system permease protein
MIMIGGSPRYRWPSVVGTFVAVLLAAALVAGCGALLATGLRGTLAPERYAGAAVMVAGDQNAHATKHKKGKTKTKSKPLAERVWIPADLAGRVAGVPGVRAVVPDVDFPAYLMMDGRPVGGPDGTPSEGHGWASAALTPLTVREGRPPRAADEIVIDAGLAGRTGIRPGSRVTVRTTGAATAYRVVGITDGGLERQAAVFFTDDEARTLAGRRGQVAALGVLPADGVSPDGLRGRLERVLAGTPGRVYAGRNALGALEFLDAAGAKVRLTSMAATLAGMSLLVAMLVVVGTVGLGVRQRHREIALLRAVGATRRQLRALIGREVLLVAAVAAAAGCLASVAVADWLRGRLVAAGAIPDNLEPVSGPIPRLAAAAAVIAAAWVAARVAARRALRISAAEALTEAAAPPARTGGPRLGLGVLALAASIVLTMVLRGLSTEPAATPVAFGVSVLWVVTVALLGPVVVRVATAIVGVPLRRLAGASGHLAALTTRADARRLAAAVVPLTLMVTMACTILFTRSTLEAAASRQARAGTLASYALTAPGPGVPREAAQAAREVPGVTAVTEIVRTEVRGPGQARYSVQGITPDGAAATLDPDVRAGSLAGLATDTAAVSTTTARRAGVGVGDDLRLTLGDGTPVTVRVTAVYGRGLGFGDILLSRDLVAAHVDDPLDAAVLIRAAADGLPADGRTGDGLAAALTAAAGRVAPVRVVGREAFTAGGPAGVGAATGADANREVQRLMLALIVGFAALSTANTLAMTALERHREFTLLAALGATRRQIGRLVSWESAVLTAIAAVLGTATGLTTVAAFGAGVAGSAPNVPLPSYLAILVSATVLTLVTTRLSTRVAVSRPTDLLGTPD